MRGGLFFISGHSVTSLNPTPDISEWYINKWSARSRTQTHKQSGVSHKRTKKKDWRIIPQCPDCEISPCKSPSGFVQVTKSIEVSQRASGWALKANFEYLFYNVKAHPRKQYI